MATLKDVAECAGVSVATVSKVVNDVDTYMSVETRQKVEAALIKCGYRPNIVARGLKTRRTNTIGYILPDITNPFYAEIGKGIEHTAKERGYSLIISDSEIDLEAEIKSIELMKTKMVDGIILGTRMFFRDEIKEDIFEHTLIVVIGRITANVKNRNWGLITLNEEEMVAESVCRLKAAGCKKIGFISSSEMGKTETNARLNSFLQAMEEQEMEIDEKRIYLDEYNLETGCLGLGEILKKGVGMDGVICGNDLIAIGVLEAAKKYGLSIPGDMKIIGFDDIFFAKYTTPKLSTISQPAYEIGRAAAKMLIDRIENIAELRVETLECAYIERETV